MLGEIVCVRGVCVSPRRRRRCVSVCRRVPQVICGAGVSAPRFLLPGLLCPRRQLPFNCCQKTGEESK